MKAYTLVNWSTKEAITIEALYCECDPKTYVWELGKFDEENNKIKLCHYSSRMWDIREIKEI